MISTGVFGFIADEAAAAPSVVEAVVGKTLLAPAGEGMDLESNDGVGVDTESCTRPRRLKALLDAPPTSDELLIELFSGSSDFFSSIG